MFIKFEVHKVSSVIFSVVSHAIDLKADQMMSHTQILTAKQ